MIRTGLFLCCTVLLLAGSVRAVQLPEDLAKAFPEQAREVLQEEEAADINGFSAGIRQILCEVGGQAGSVFRQHIKKMAAVLLVVILCSAAEGIRQSGDKKTPVFLTMTGVLAITLLAVGNLDSMMGLGTRTMEDLRVFSKALLPTLAAAVAAAGAVSSAAIRQVTTVFFVDLLLNLINGLLMPMVTLYVGTLCAAACLCDERLHGIAELMKKTVTWILTAALLAFTAYLSIAGVFSGTADGMTVKIAKATISGVVPIVGGIIADAAETVLAGAGMLKGVIGVFGVLGILGACAYPFLQLGIQYLLYKVTAFLAAVFGTKELCKLIDGLGGAFGLILGMTGSCALLLLISILASVAAVTG